MTLAQLDALMRVEERAHKTSNADQTAKLPHPSKRNWGTAHDFGYWERRANG